MNKFKLTLIGFLLLTNNIILAAEPPKRIKIAAGGIMKSYFEVAIKLCDFFESSNINLKCSVVETSGSRENLELLQKGKVDLAISQSDIAIYAFDGTKCYDDPYLNLRQILKLYDETFTVIVKDDDHIKTFADLAGRKITCGKEHTGSSITYNEIKSQYNFIPPTEVTLSPEDYARKLCAGEIDAVILVTGHPNKIVNHISNTCNVEFVSIEQEKLNKVIAHNKAYYETILHKGTYTQIDEDQKTIGVSAVLLSNDSMNDEIIDNFMSYFKAHLTDFKKSNIRLDRLPDDYFTTGFVIPLHDQCLPKEHGQNK